MSALELFARPAWLAALPLAPLVWLALLGRDRVRRRRLRELCGPRAPALASELEPGRRSLRRGLFAAALLLVLLALAEPRLGAPTGPIGRRPLEIVLCLDVSRSMLARDVAPSRLERARAEISELAERARGDRVALVLFAGEARLAVPLTRDLDSLVELAALADPASVTLGGTDLGAALEAALEALLPGDEPRAGRDGGHAAVVVLSDGEDHAGGGRIAAQRLFARGIPVHCVGLGTAAGGKIPIPSPGAAPAGETFLRDRQGREVVTRLDPRGLSAIAEAGGGRYVDASEGVGSLARIHERHLLAAARRSSREGPDRQPPARFQWPLLAAFALWMLELCLSERRRG